MTPSAVIEGNRGRLLPRLRLMRLPNAVTAVADVVAGGALAGAPPGRLVPLAAAASLIYAGGCVLNDLADREIDGGKHPHRPLPTGAVSSGEAGLLAILLLTAGVGAAAATGPPSALAATILVLLVLLYDLGAKAHPFAGPLCMGLCRGSAVVLGMTPAFPPPPAAFLFPLGSVLFVFALSRLARFENSPFPPPTAGIIVSALGAVLLTAAGLFLLSGGRPFPVSAFLLLFALVAGAGLLRGLRGGKGEVAAGVGTMILAIPLLDAVAAAGASGWGGAIVAACCALPPWLARKRFYLT